MLDASARPPGPRLELKGRAAFFLPLHLQQLFKIIIIKKKNTLKGEQILLALESKVVVTVAGRDNCCKRDALYAAYALGGIPKNLKVMKVFHLH